jgi:hypothetical protein
MLPTSHAIPLVFQDNCTTDPSAATSSMDMEIDPEIAAAMGFGSFGGAPKKRKFGADDAFTSASQITPNPQEPQRIASKANAVPVAEVRSQRRPVETNELGKCPRCLTAFLTCG